MKIAGKAVCVFCLLIPSLAMGLGKVKFGPEFTFSDPNASGGRSEERVLARMKAHLIDGQPEGAKFSFLDTGRKTFASPNGWVFAIGTDPGVLEVRVNPGSPAYFRHFQADMQDAIFVSAANEGHFPAMFLGGGHINVGVEIFKNNSLLLRNFLVDLYNHNELFMGVFNYDTNNALPWNLAKEETKLEIFKILDGFDCTHLNSEKDQYDFLQSLVKILNLATDPYGWSSGTRNKHHAVNLVRVDEVLEKSRIELRGVRPQASMDVWIRQIDLIYHRILYLETLKYPIAILPRVPVERIDLVFKNHRLNPPVNPQRALRSFYQYVRESGLDWQDHRDYLWPKWITNGELDKFEKSFWFKKFEYLKSIKHVAEQCESVLGA